MGACLTSLHWPSSWNRNNEKSANKKKKRVATAVAVVMTIIIIITARHRMYGSSSRMDDNGIKCATGRQTRKEAVGYVVRQSRAASPLRRAWMKAHRFLPRSDNKSRLQLVRSLSDDSISYGRQSDSGGRWREPQQHWRAIECAILLLRLSTSSAAVVTLRLSEANGPTAAVFNGRKWEDGRGLAGWNKFDGDSKVNFWHRRKNKREARSV